MTRTIMLRVECFAASPPAFDWPYALSQGEAPDMHLGAIETYPLERMSVAPCAVASRARTPTRRACSPSGDRSRAVHVRPRGRVTTTSIPRPGQGGHLLGVRADRPGSPLVTVKPASGRTRMSCGPVVRTRHERTAPARVWAQESHVRHAGRACSYPTGACLPSTG